LPFVSAVELAPGAEGEETGTNQGKWAQYECCGELEKPGKALAQRIQLALVLTYPSTV